MIIYEKNKVESATKMIKSVYFNTYNFESEKQAIEFAVGALFKILDLK